MNQFELNELKGREQFKTFAETKLKDVHYILFAKEQYSRTDLTYWSGWTITNSEIKTRDYNHNKIFFGNSEPEWLLEKSKYDELKALSKKDHSNSTYINIFPDNKIVIWDLTNTEINDWKETWYWETNEKKRKVKKQVAYLKLSEASHIFNI
jgi:hypothetical protein